MSRLPSIRRPSMRLAAALVAVVSIAACSAIGVAGTTRIGSPPYERGSGHATTVSRSLAAFHAVAASQGVRVLLSTGAASGARVTVDDNLADNITTEVRDGTLHVDVSGSIETATPLDVSVTASTPLDGISVGTGASVDVEDLSAAALAVSVSTGARLRAGGRAGTIDLSVDTGATADMRNVEAGSARVHVSTGSTAYINVGASVLGDCTGGSTLHVRGAPATVDVATDVSSSVERE
jgi:Putative auto-transporter adhesin, head GIN domain